MADKTMEDIKNGKGLAPLPNNPDSNNNNPGITPEKRSENGITYLTYTRHDNEPKNQKDK